MKVQGKQYRSVWVERRAADRSNERRPLAVKMIDQTLLPHRFVIATMETHRQTAEAIRGMTIRGAPAIGAAGAYGLAQAAAEAPEGDEGRDYIRRAEELLRSTRPTGHDLFYMLDRVIQAIEGSGGPDRADQALKAAERLVEESVLRCRKIGEHGAELIQDDMRILTHCNAGWLACVDWGTALAPLYVALRQGRRARVFIDETRPQLQGTRLTAWELAHEGLAGEIIADNAAGLLMRQGEVQIVITGADRIAANGDVANKVGTYEKAVLARENKVPFYVAAPASTFDLNCATGEDIPIEERSAEEVLFAHGLNDMGEMTRVRLAPEGSLARNPAFDITPAELITGLITEFGIIQASPEAIGKIMGRSADEGAR